MATETVLRSSGVYTTILGALNQFQAFTDCYYSPLPETTLNYKYGYNKPSSQVVYVDEPAYTPTLSYFGIGVRGFVNSGDYDAIPDPGDARMIDLHAPLPIRCVPIIDGKDDLTDEERKLYRLRVVREYNGSNYALYYLKKIDFEKGNSGVSIVSRSASGEEEPFDLNLSNLISSSDDGTSSELISPMNNEVGGLITQNRIIIRIKGYCTVTHNEIMEAVNVIHGGDLNYARISEIGYYTGYDVDVSENWKLVTEDNNLTPKYKEAVYVQLAKGHCFRGSELSTPNSVIQPIVTLESESCISGTIV